MRRKQILSFIMIVILIGSTINISFAYDQAQAQIDKDNGRIAGEIAGEIAAQRDYINDRTKDWEKAYKEEETKAITLYDLNSKSYFEKYNFLEGFEKAFQESYEKTYRSLVAQDQTTSTTLPSMLYQYGVSHGEFFGSLLGFQNGIKEYHEGKTNDWRRSVPSEAQLIREYSLSRDSKNYSNEFILSFQKAYQLAYIEAFRHANVENHRVTKEKGLEHGYTAGKKQGEILGRVHFIEGKDNDWRSALPTETEIILQANLIRENTQYREGFIAGYIEGFKVGFTESFQNSNLTSVMDNLQATEVSMMGANIKSTDELLSLEIKPGTFYWETIFSVEKDLQPMYQHNTKRLEALSRKYEIAVLNNIGYVVLKEPITLSFKYYGSDRAGIYQMINGEWRYLYSKIEGNTITTVIPAGVFSGGTYTVMLDEKYPELRDIYTYWASDEIYTFVRRFYVAGYTDGTFRPMEHVSRAEFVTLLGRVLKWTAKPTGESNFTDANQFGVYNNSILQAVEEGYIKGYPDNTFKPKNPITYQEIEWIMQRVPGNKEFMWQEIEDDMLYEKFTRSESRLSMKNKITRGEIIYMLHQLQQDGKF